MGLFALLGATLVIFAGSRYLVDPVMAALAPIDDMDDASSFTPEQIEGMRKKLRLDRPVPVQYTLWVWDLLNGHLGNDIVDSQRPIAQKLRQKFPHTLQIAVPAYIVAALVGIPIGVLSAVTRGSVWDMAGRVFAAVGSRSRNFGSPWSSYLYSGFTWNCSLWPARARASPTETTSCPCL